MAGGEPLDAGRRPRPAARVGTRPAGSRRTSAEPCSTPAGRARRPWQPDRAPRSRPGPGPPVRPAAMAMRRRCRMARSASKWKPSWWTTAHTAVKQATVMSGPPTAEAEPGDVEQRRQADHPGQGRPGCGMVAPPGQGSQGHQRHVDRQEPHGRDDQDDRRHDVAPAASPLRRASAQRRDEQREGRHEQAAHPSTAEALGCPCRRLRACRTPPMAKKIGMGCSTQVASHIPGVTPTGLPTWGPSAPKRMVVNTQCHTTTMPSAPARARSMSRSRPG